MVVAAVETALVRLEGKIDALSTQLGVLQVEVATQNATLEGRVTALERSGDRRWALVPTWVASVVALVLAALPYLHR